MKKKMRKITVMLFVWILLGAFFFPVSAETVKAAGGTNPEDVTMSNVKAGNNPYKKTYYSESWGRVVYNCVWYAWQKTYDTLGISLPPFPVNAEGWAREAAKVGYTVGQAPVPNSIAVWQNGGAGHVAYVEAVDGDNVTISEAGGGYGACHRVTLNMATMRNRPYDGALAGFIYLEKDDHPPVVSNARVTEVSRLGYRVTCDVSDDTGVSKVYFPTWTAKNSQAVWYEGEIRGNTATYYVQASQHNNESGTYYTDIYAHDFSGNISARVGVTAVIDRKEPSISDVKVFNITATGYSVSCKVTDDTGVARVQFPTWTYSGNQDDLLTDWADNPLASGMKKGNTYTYTVKISEHNNERGIYATHIYASDNAGNTAKAETSAIINGSNTLRPVEDGTYVFYSGLGNNKVLDISGAQTNDGANAAIWDYEKASNQKFQVSYLGKGYYKITALHSKKVLDVCGGTEQDGTNAQQYTWNGTNSQRWVFVDAGNGYYRIQSEVGTFLNVSNSSGENGSNVWMQRWNQNLSQKWKISAADNVKPVTLSKPSVTLKSVDYRTVQVSWKKIKGAGGYYVYRKTGNSKWSCLTKITKAETVKYLDKTAVTGRKYYYTVKAFAKSGGKTIYSKYPTNIAGKAVLTTPQVKLKTSGKNKVTISWKDISGESGYIIYRKQGLSGWVKIKSLKAGKTVFTDKPPKGKKTYYKVLAYRLVNGQKSYSGYQKNAGITL